MGDLALYSAINARLLFPPPVLVLLLLVVVFSRGWPRGVGRGGGGSFPSSSEEKSCLYADLGTSVYPF